MLITLLLVCLYVAAAVLGLAAFLTVLPRLRVIGGRRVAEHLARAPLLDVMVAGLTWVPWVYGAYQAGWLGVPAALAGQAAAMYAWVAWHERSNRKRPAAGAGADGPTIFGTLNRIVGRGRNHAALWVTLVALPGFWFIRLVEIFCYPFLVWLLNFPKYKQGEWVNVSRQKFDGLVGHDLLWCLYCDWMTGVYSLGAELLRNVESFWCPIRFYDGKKCANCRTDFPDIDGGWVPADGTLAQVTETLERQYGNGRREWFGHPARLTVGGQEPRQPG
jgi:hypothetical protein